MLDEGSDLGTWDDPRRRHSPRVFDLPLEANERVEVVIRSRKTYVVRGPVVRASDSLDVHCEGLAPSASNEDVDGFLVAKGETCLGSKPMEHGENVKLGSEIRVVGSSRLEPPPKLWESATSVGRLDSWGRCLLDGAVEHVAQQRPCAAA